MSIKTCDYTRPGVEHWWSTADQGADGDDLAREGFSSGDSRNS